MNATNQSQIIKNFTDAAVNLKKTSSSKNWNAFSLTFSALFKTFNSNFASFPLWIVAIFNEISKMTSQSNSWNVDIGILINWLSAYELAQQCKGTVNASDAQMLVNSIKASYTNEIGNASPNVLCCAQQLNTSDSTSFCQNVSTLNMILNNSNPMQYACTNCPVEPS